MTLDQKIMLTLLVYFLGFAYGTFLDVEYRLRNMGLGTRPHFLDYVFGCHGMAVLTAAIAAWFIW